MFNIVNVYEPFILMLFLFLFIVHPGLRIQRTHIPWIEPSRNTMGMKGMSAFTPAYLASRLTIQPIEAFYTWVHYVIAADCTRLYLYIQWPQPNYVPAEKFKFWFIIRHGRINIEENRNALKCSSNIIV